MRLYLSVSIFLFLIGCAPKLQQGQPIQMDTKCIEKFKPVFKSDWYKASVDVVGKHISGLMLFKTLRDSSVRIVFTNEAGVKFFDFEFQANGNFIAHQVIRQLNKKPVIKTLRNDFELMMMSRVGKETPIVYQQGNEVLFAFARKKETDCVVTNTDCSALLSLEKKSSKKKKVIAQLFGERSHAPDSIALQHYNFNMNIKLKRLERL